jgi:hypothetical protein
MDTSFAAQAVADATSDEQIDRALFEYAGAHGRFHGLARADFQYHRVHTAPIKQVRKQQPRGTSANDRDLRSAG